MKVLTNYNSICFTVLILVSSFLSEAQWSYGVNSAFNSTFLVNKNEVDAGADLDFLPTWGYELGINASRTINSQLSAQAQLKYANEGQTYISNPRSSGAFQYSLQSHFIKLAFPFRYAPKNKKGNPVQFSLSTGPQIWALLDIQFTLDESPPIIELDFNYNSLYRKFALGWQLNIGPSIQITQKMLMDIHFRIDISFTDIENKNALIKDVPFWQENRVGTRAASTGFLLQFHYLLP